MPRSRSRPRRRWVLTVDSGRSVWRAISSSDRSPKNRRATTSRYGSGRAATALRRSARALGAHDDHRRVRLRPRRHRLRVRDVGASGVRRIPRLEPRDRSPFAGLPDGDAHRDARQPGAERTVAAPAGERAIGGHECLLGSVLGFVQVAEHPMARPDDRCRFTLDQVAIGIAIAGEDGVHDRAVIALIPGADRGSGVDDRSTPWGRIGARTGRRRSARLQCEGGRARPSVVPSSGHQGPPGPFDGQS